MNKPFSIAIDGPSGAGKSSIAREVASRVGAMYLDTGAMYRALGLYMMRNGIVNNASLVISSLKEAPVSVVFQNNEQHLLLGCEDVTKLIRKPDVSSAASLISTIPEVRQYMIAFERRITEGQNIVMDGRDIGTTVLPNASMKIYLTASASVRAQRRCTEMNSMGIPSDFEEVLHDIIKRDYQDTHRKTSPLRRSKDAIVVDTSHLSLEDSISTVMELIRQAGIILQ